MNESKERERHTHPSFGQLSFSRISSSGGQKFYGSELPQDHYIQMELKHSEVDRDLTQDWYYAHDSIVRLRMSSGQFAELITSMNSGDGSCCTIEYIEGKKIDDIDKQESRKEFIHRNFEDRMHEFAQAIKAKKEQAKEIVKKKTLSKDDQHDLLIHLDWLTQEISSNIPFFMKCFQETMDEVVYEAKTEVENAIQHKINVLGLTALHEQQNLLTTLPAESKPIEIENK